MKVLLTGANGFVGSHVLDGLLAAGHDARLLLRETSNTRFIADHLARTEVRYGSLDAPEPLRGAVAGVDAVIHCAGVTKAARRAAYHAANAAGALHVAEACNASEATVRRLVLISSLAATGPGTVEAPARADGPARPVSEYGRSKLEGERHVRERCRVPWTILRPAAVYGPRDRDFLLVFRGVRGRLVPVFGGSKPLSLVYVEDLADCVLRALDAEHGAGGTYHVAHPDPVTQRAFMRAIEAAVGARPVHVRVPGLAVTAACAARGAWARLSGRPGILSMDKAAELRAPGWVCDTADAARDLGFEASTRLADGLGRTAEWYAEAGWLRHG
ncbi:MAG: NAD-dependent epimerase/dehydratase family protein [Candidatus Brocadiaceae bacterium]|nr:NAD-dependent epimerase/dehydratase family protein [Candidatus Brocadiaceae bacterium]